MKKIKFQHQRRIQKVINILHSCGHPSAIVAGGALRDSILDRPVSDIDVYITEDELNNKKISSYSSAHFATYMFNLFKEHEKNNFYIKPVYNDTYTGSSRHITAICNVMFSDIKVQIIVLKRNPIKYVEKHFDIGLCKVYFDGEKVRMTPDFIKDMNTKTLTVCAPDLTREELQYTMNFHLPKLQQKYPEFQHDLAPHVQTMFTQLLKDMLNNIPF